MFSGSVFPAMKSNYTIHSLCFFASNWPMKLDLHFSENVRMPMRVEQTEKSLQLKYIVNVSRAQAQNAALTFTFWPRRWY